MAFGGDELEGIAQFPADGDVEDRHGAAGTFMGRGEQALEEDGAGIGEEIVVGAGGARVDFVGGAVVDGAVLGEDDGEHDHAEEGFGVVELDGVLAEAVEVAVGFGADAVGPGLEGAEGLQKRWLRDGEEVLGAEEIDAGDGHLGHVVAGKDEERRQGVGGAWGRTANQPK